MAKKKVGKKNIAQIRRNGVVRIAVVGTGGMGRAHCGSIPSSKREIDGGMRCKSASAAEVGKRWGVPHFNDHRELIKANLCDMITIATPHPLHMQVAVDAMNAGLHVLTEKPLTESVATAEKWCKRKTQQCGFTVMFQLRFSAI